MSGVAVAITLVFLILGIRDNTQVMRATAYKGYMDSLNDFQIAQMGDPDLLRVWDAFIYEKVANFDELDTIRLDLSILNLFRIYESAYFSSEYGLIGERERGRFENTICQNFRRVRSAGRDETLRSSLSVEFWQYISECAPE